MDIHTQIKNLLYNKRLHLITGKGGVGKSVISLSLALTLKRRKKRVLFAQMSPVESDRVANIEAFEQFRHQLPDLDYIYIEPGSALEEYAMMILKFKRLYRLIFEDRMVRSSIRAMPSLSFLLLIGKLWYYCTKKKSNGDYVYDYVVVDAPSTGMAISMLNLPHIINDAAPPGLLRDRALDIERMLTDSETTSVHIATTCEETPVNEATQLYEFIGKRLSIQMGLFFVNQYEYFSSSDRDYIEANRAKLPEFIHNCIIKRMREIEYKYREYERLVSHISPQDRRIINIPLFENRFDTYSIVKDISRYMEGFVEQRDQ